jgi:hypothetical protein
MQSHSRLGLPCPLQSVSEFTECPWCATAESGSAAASNQEINSRLTLVSPGAGMLLLAVHFTVREAAQGDYAGKAAAVRTSDKTTASHPSKASSSA